MRCDECNAILSPDDNQLARLCSDCEALLIAQDNIFEVRDEA